MGGCLNSVLEVPLDKQHTILGGVTGGSDHKEFAQGHLGRQIMVPGLKTGKDSVK